VTKVQLGQAVTLTIDSLSGWRATGNVSYIAPTAETTNDVVTYGVRVSFPDADQRVKVGMTANVDITTATKNDVLLVPNTALLPKGAGRVVRVPNASGQGTHEVDVQIGLTDGTNTEIVSGLKEGDPIVALPSTSSAGTSAGGGGGGPFRP
jgi:multidrug efflux pump subunit AcrA (membrane-fusion protein)